jgi:hypothetical protein
MDIHQHRVAHDVTPEQWKELASVESIAQSFGVCEEADPGKALSECAYGVRFTFSPMTMPSYMGDLFILVGDAIDAPLSVIRDRDGSLLAL